MEKFEELTYMTASVRILSVMNVFYKIFRFVAFLWLGLALLVPSLHGVVLCIDDSGNVAIEPASHQGCCQDHEESTGDTEDSSTLALNAIANHGCHDCIDLPLSTDDVSILIKSVNFDTLVKFKLVRVADDMSAIFDHNELRTVQTMLLYDRSLGRSALLDMQKTTILRV